MKDLIWSDTLSVQVDEIDADHRRLIDLYHILKSAVEEGITKDYLEALMEELISCTEYHFRHEERLMVKYEYEGFAEHKQEHQELIESAKEFKKEILSGDKQIGTEDIKSLEDWLTGHIFCSDMDLGSYLCEVM